MLDMRDVKRIWCVKMVWTHGKVESEVESKEKWESKEDVKGFDEKFCVRFLNMQRRVRHAKEKVV